MRITITLIFCFLSVFCFTQTDTLRVVCFAKCMVPTFEQEEDFAFPAWTNEDSVYNLRMVSQREIDVPEHSRWLKKKADVNCQSENPDDCISWKEIKVPTTFKIIKEYSDETPENFSTEEFLDKNFENFVGSLEYHPILCEELIDEKILRAVVKELKYDKYLHEKARVELNEKTWKALYKFQLDNKLPVGNLNLATLDFMNLEY